MKLTKLEWIIVLVALALGTTLLFIGSVFFYWGAWNYLFGYGPRPAGLEYVFMFGGGAIILGGIFAASYLGKKLKGRYLATISLMHLVVAPSLIYLIFSVLDPYYIAVFMSPIILSNIALDVAFLIGYFRKK